MEFAMIIMFIIGFIFGIFSMWIFISWAYILGTPLGSLLKKSER